MNTLRPHQGNQATNKWGPLPKDHKAIGMECPGCNQKIISRTYITLVVIGPGDDRDERKKARAGSTYNAVSVPAHWSCVTGEVDHLEVLTSGEQPPQ